MAAHGPTIGAAQALVAAEAVPSRRRQGGRYLVYRLRYSPLSIVGLGIVGLIIGLAVIGPAFAPYNPIEGNLLDQLQGPSWSHLMGTDTTGRDIFSRVLYAGRTDLAIACASVGTAFALAVLLGAAAGYVGGKLDEAIMRVMDIVMSFPSFILAIGIAVAAGAGEKALIIALSVVGVPVFTRLMRGEMLVKRELSYAEAAEAIGNPHVRIVFRHLVPNCLTPVLIQATLAFGYVVLDVAGLSFVGVGVNDPTPEWGLMISQGVPLVLTGQWWVSVFPGLMIFLTVIGFNLFGDGIREIFDPRARRG